MLEDAARKGDATDLTRTYTVEVEGSGTPAVVADCITRLVRG